MLIVRGRHAGKTGQLHQFANNWITVDLNGRTEVVSPRHVKLNDDTEYTAFEESQGNPSVGQFWHEWQMHDDGTFTRRPRT